VSEYQFDPSTLILHLPGRADRFADGPNLAAEFHAHYTSLVHECAHWLQFNGTTFGAFIQLVVYSQTQNALGRLEAMNPRKRRRLVDERVRKRRAIVSDHASTDAELNDLRQNWLDHEYTYRLVVDGLRPTLRVDRSGLVSFVGGVCCLSVCAQAGFQPYDGDDWAAGIMGGGRMRIFELTTRSGPLSVRTLLEGAASAQELLAVSDLAGLSILRHPRTRMARQRLVAKLVHARDSYGVAFRHFMRHLRLSVRDACRDDTLRLFAFICDLALNPTVPPARMPSTPRSDWWQIYPPARFQALLQELEQPKLLARRLSPSTIATMRDTLLRRAGLPQDPIGFIPEWGTMTYQAFRNRFSSDSELMEHQRYRFWVQARLAALRQAYPWAFISVHDVFLGGSGTQSWRYDKQKCIGWFMPPIRWAFKGTNRSTVGFQYIDAEHGSDILMSAAAHDAQYCLLKQRGPLTLSHYPRANRSEIRRSVRASYEARFGCAAFARW
jgi:hypothetical protein